jgi:hypothetical protein
MGRRTRAHLANLTVPATLAAALAVAGLAPTATATASVTGTSTANKASHGPKLVQVGLGTFWECPSKTTRILIAVNTLNLHPGSTLHINFVVRNQSLKACNYVAPYASVAPGPTSTTLGVGPCGSIGFEVMGPGRHNVWPGPQSFNCPALGFAQLQPGATVSGNGSWNQKKPNSSTRVAAGSYTLVVGGHYKFPLRIARS